MLSFLEGADGILLYYVELPQPLHIFLLEK